MEYWAKRIAKEQEAVANKSILATERQLQKYYIKCSKKILDDFEQLYNKIFQNIDEGREITPADLYKLDKYWKMQGELSKELEKLGNYQIAVLGKEFNRLITATYGVIKIPNVVEPTFTTIDKAVAGQIINSIWAPDGKIWSDRVWDNTKRLQQTLNENLIHCLITGRKTSDLKKLLQERFNVSYRRAETLIRTEMAHIQTETAKQRYKDYGIKYVEVLVSADHKTCDKCKALIGKQFSVNGAPPLPVHPNERCCLVPVIN